MSNGLAVSPTFAFPRETVVGRQAILATSGAGKSNTAVVLAEAMYDAGLPWCAVDPKGDWWGVRAGANGKTGGLQVPIFGGLHGDVPLEPSGGKLVADLIVDRRLTCVLDVSEFDTSQDRFRFLADFAETLLKRNTQPLHVFAEEADEYLPQQAREKGNLPRCLGAWQRLVKRGRFRGIGSTLITQRSAAINKDVLNMLETLIVMRTTAPLDRKEVAKWVTARGMAKDLLDSLPLLEDGEAWVWSPQKLKVVERVMFSRRRTYDSGATPLMDAKASKAATLADIDLGALREQWSEVIERAEADDPKKLHARIRELERELAKKAKPEVVKEMETVTVEVVPAAVVDGLRASLARYDDTIGSMQQSRTVVKAALAEAEKRKSPRAGTTRASIALKPAPTIREQVGVGSRPPAPLVASSAARLGTPVGAAAKRLLMILAQHPDGVPKARAAALGGFSVKKSTIRNAISELRVAGFAEAGEPYRATPAGIEHVADEVEPLPSGQELLEHWYGKIGAGAARALLDVLIAAYPHALDRDVAAERSGVDAGTSTIRNAISTLRTLGIADKQGFRADDDFMAAIQG